MTTRAASRELAVDRLSFDKLAKRRQGPRTKAEKVRFLYFYTPLTHLRGRGLEVCLRKLLGELSFMQRRPSRKGQGLVVTHTHEPEKSLSLLSALRF